MSRIHGSTEWSRCKLLCMVVLASSVMACKSTGTPGPSESSTQPEECLAETLQPQPSLTYTVTCDGFIPKAQRVTAGAQVTFVSDCGDKEVSMSFSNPSTLFTSGVPLIVLKDKGDQKVETVSTQGGCHEMCFGPTCPLPDDMDSKTGSLDVYTTGGPEPVPSTTGGP